jgi:SAM-dependent methyltransferase
MGGQSSLLMISRKGYFYHMMERNNEYNFSLEQNRSAWNDRTEIHIQSKFYKQPDFINGWNSLNEIELSLLGELKGLRVLHLQCHFGQDSISLSRMGAHVTGVDFSEKAIAYAQQTAQELQADAAFICCDIYGLPKHLDQPFDLVFTSYGTIGWLPDLSRWAEIISGFLKPNGRFVFVEFHPVVWMFDDRFSNIAYDYFNTGPITEDWQGTYADKSLDISSPCVMWNHGLGEVFNALTANDLNVMSFQEYDYSPYPCFKNAMEFEQGKYRISHLTHKIPLVYALVAKKNDSF